MPPLDTPPDIVQHRQVFGVQRRTSRWGRLRAVLPALIPPLLFLPMVLAPPVNHDVAAVLQFSQRWFAGERLYSDLIDVNPPLIFVLNLIPAAIGAMTPINAVVALQLGILLYGLACWRIAYKVRDRREEGFCERAFLDVLPLLFLLGAGYDFGQREHLMAIGALPYLLASARRAQGVQPRLRMAAGVVAGVAFALKPHFLAIPGLVEIAVLAGRGQGGWRRAFRITVADRLLWAMALVWVIYLVSLPLVFSDYLGFVVPLVWDYYLDLGGLSALEVLLQPRLATVLVLLTPLLWLAFRRGLAPDAARPRMFALAALGALASAVAQHKGFSYHIVPIEFFASALACVLVCRWLDGLDTRLPSPYRIAAVLGGLSLLYTISNGEAPWKELDYRNSEVAGLTALLQKTAPGAPVLVLSPGIYPIFPALNYASVRLTLRSMNMWLLQGAYDQCLPDGRRYRDVWEMGRAELSVFHSVAEDFARAPPAAVLVDRDPGIPWCGSQFDFLAYFMRNPLFAQVWSHYELSAEWDRYRLYKRRD
jgi:hypothetical protein